MARVNSTLGVIYTDDFGRTQDYPLPFKIHADAPLPDDYYVDRTQIPCTSAGSGFKMRKIFATFTPTQDNADLPNGTFEYPVKTVRGDDGILNLAKKLIALGAICIDVQGEKWLRVGKGVIGSTDDFKSEPYTDIPGEPDKEGYIYTYQSDVEEVGEDLTLSVSVEKLPEILRDAQIDCLLDAVKKDPSSKTICSVGSLGISPRRFIIQALSRSAEAEANNIPADGTVVRNSIVSEWESEAHKECGSGLVTIAYCLGYRGENIKNLQELVDLSGG